MSDAPDIETDDLDAQVARVDPDRWLSSRFIADAHRRADVIALYAFDHELARAPRVASNAILGEIRLTWWSEVLEQIFDREPVRRHPTAQALAHAVTHWSLPREPLEAMIEARFRELDPTPMTPDEALAWARGSAGAGAMLAAAVLSSSGAAEQARDAGALWALSLRQAGRAAGGPDYADTIEALGEQARAGARTLPVAAFPAVAHAALARSYARGRRPSQMGRRLRLTWATATGAI